MLREEGDGGVAQAVEQQLVGDQAIVLEVPCVLGVEADRVRGGGLVDCRVGDVGALEADPDAPVELGHREGVRDRQGEGRREVEQAGAIDGVVADPVRAGGPEAREVVVTAPQA